MHIAQMTINREERALIFRAEGHSGYAERGQDIVCAAASMLAMTLIKRVEKMYKAGWVNDDIVISFDPEGTEVSCIAADDEAFGELARAYLTISDGYGILSEHYPDHVKFTNEIKL